MPPLEPTRPRAAPAFYLGHGLGNDYLVFEEDPEGWRAGPGAVEAVCHRQEGVGSDGIVVLLEPADEEPFRLRIFNPDGGEVERSGNGLRILASHLRRTGRVEEGRPFRVAVGGDELEMTVHGRSAEGLFDVSVGMGRARTGAGAVEADGLRIEAGPGDGEGVVDHPVVGPVQVHMVSLGNPHAVVFADTLEAAGGPLRFDRESLERVGPGLSTHRGFGNGINVQLARVVEGDAGAGSGPGGEARPGAGAGSGVLDVLIWERGVGHTTASGTSACAVAVAAVQSGRVPAGRVGIRTEGGTLEVEVSRELEVVLRGPVQEVCGGRLSEGFLRSLLPQQPSTS